MKTERQKFIKVKLLLLSLCMSAIFMVCGGNLYIKSVQASTSITAHPTTSTILVNGNSAIFDSYNINGSNYLKLRDLAFVMSGTEKQFEVGYDRVNNVISLTSSIPYTTVGGEMISITTSNKIAIQTSANIYLDGQPILLTAYNIDGSNYFKLRDIGETLNFNVDWDKTKNIIIIDTTKSYTKINEMASNKELQSNSNKIVFTESEQDYLKVFLNIIKNGAILDELFVKAVNANDLEAMIVVSVEISNLVEPLYHISCPSERLEQLYKYMEEAANDIQAVPYFLNFTYQQGDFQGLVRANEEYKKFTKNYVNAVSEIEKLRLQEEALNSTNQ